GCVVASAGIAVGAAFGGRGDIDAVLIGKEFAAVLSYAVKVDVAAGAFKITGCAASADRADGFGVHGGRVDVGAPLRCAVVVASTAVFGGEVGAVFIDEGVIHNAVTVVVFEVAHLFCFLALVGFDI